MPAFVKGTEKAGAGGAVPDPPQLAGKTVCDTVFAKQFVRPAPEAAV
jgi:hypothetical protein